ncbi:hypothetical protein BC829DRAFT_441318 [Chytridium lagenaria]|nr:hypothetical protein BC829DRAFT_441318 [Chytridium lagenaria]
MTTVLLLLNPRSLTPPFHTPCFPSRHFAERVYGKSVKCALFVKTPFRTPTSSSSPRSHYEQALVPPIIDPELCSSTDPSDFGYWPRRLSPHRRLGPLGYNLGTSTHFLELYSQSLEVDTVDRPGKRKASHTDRRLPRRVCQTPPYFTYEFSTRFSSLRRKTVLKVQTNDATPSDNTTGSALPDTDGFVPVSSIFATSIESEVENLPATVANHFVSDSVTITYTSDSPLPAGSPVMKTIKGPAKLLSLTSTSMCSAVPPLHLTEPYSLEMVIDEFDVITVLTRSPIDSHTGLLCLTCDHSKCDCRAP